MIFNGLWQWTFKKANYYDFLFRILRNFLRISRKFRPFFNFVFREIFAKLKENFAKTRNWKFSQPPYFQPYRSLRYDDLDFSWAILMVSRLVLNITDFVLLHLNSAVKAKRKSLIWYFAGNSVITKKNFLAAPFEKGFAA